MPQCCAVPFCSETKGGHKFPRDPQRLRQWVNAIGRRDFIPSKHARVCKRHFTPNDYEVPVKPNSIIYLKKIAVPSRFVWTDWKDTSYGNSGTNFIQYLNDQTLVKKGGFDRLRGSNYQHYHSKVKFNGFTNMSETASETTVDEKPVQVIDDVKFPPFPDPTENDFDDDICEEERKYYRDKFKDLNTIKTQRLHCSACDKHLGCAAKNESRMRPHPMLRTLMCHTCHTFYNSGEFEKGDDGSELYCRWCGQGGQVYCCSDCPHVFCAKCIRRNLGAPKIKEIEQTDDWKCFKCSPQCLWDLRAMCWAVLRYCDQKNKIAYNTEDPELKDSYQKDCATDYSDCCKSKIKKKEKETNKKKDAEVAKKSTASIISKISPAIQVKKFASIIPDDRSEKKPQKRPASPKIKPILIKNPISLSGPSSINPMSLANQAKKIRMTPPMINPVRFNNKNPILVSRFKQKPAGIPILPQNHNFNGFNNVNINPFSNMVSNDNINLSLDNLTQGLDMAAVAALASSPCAQDDDVVCTPDLPLEPLCEVMEDNADDDVQCMTPGPVAAPKGPPPPTPTRDRHSLPDLAPENIIQMTENDVTVNAQTGGLKFRIDPQTLSSNKMYRLPDGRIFAINANPAMPGGYSATIVAVTETTEGKVVPKGATYAAKLSAVTTAAPQTSTPQPKPYGSKVMTRSSTRRNQKLAKVHRGTDTSSRECDLNVPVEWYRYNLIDAVDALEYSLSRLHKLKKEATTMYLRSRTINEMRHLQKTLDRLLNTSISRFNEVRDNISKEMKHYVAKKMGISNNTSEDDDDVEILPDLEENEDPIFIDENSVESNIVESQEVDLTGASEHNNSSDKSIDRDDGVVNISECLNVDGEGEEGTSMAATISMANFNAFNEDSVHDLDNNEDKQNEMRNNTGAKVEAEKGMNGDVEMSENVKPVPSSEQDSNSPRKVVENDNNQHVEDQLVDCEKSSNKFEENDNGHHIEEKTVKFDKNSIKVGENEKDQSTKEEIGNLDKKQVSEGENQTAETIEAAV